MEIKGEERRREWWGEERRVIERGEDRGEKKR